MMRILCDIFSRVLYFSFNFERNFHDSKKEVRQQVMGLDIFPYRYL